MEEHPDLNAAWNSSFVPLSPTVTDLVQVCYCCLRSVVVAVCCHGYHSAEVDVLSQQVAVVKRPFGFSRHYVHRPFVHLILYGSVEHVERLPCHLLTDRQVEVRQGLETKTGFLQTGNWTFHLEEGVEADRHPVGQHLLHNCLRPGTQTPSEQTDRQTDRHVS